jgi:hypothetical protein
MSTTFPTTLDALTNPTSTDSVATVSHADQHANANDAIEALEAKVGVDGSAVTSSLDYKLKNAASISPGHKHVLADITDYAAATDASTSVKGVTRLSTAPVSASIPIAVGDNDTRLTGTSGAVLAVGNRPVDLADVSSAGASGKVVRLNGAAYPAADGSAITGVTSAASVITATAGETIAAGNTVCVLPYSTDIITFDTSSSSSGTGTSLNSSHTTANQSNRLLIVATAENGAGDISGITYNGVALTQIGADKVYSGVGNVSIRLWRLLAPATGTNTLALTCSASITVNWNIYTFYNVAQVAQEDADDVEAASVAINLTSTPVTNGAFTFGCVGTNGGTVSGTAVANGSITNGTLRTGYSNNAYPPIAHVVSVTSSGNQAAKTAVFYPVPTALTARVYKASAAVPTTTTSYVGLANSAGTTGNSMTVTVAGSNTNQSGLTIGSQYYLSDTAGTLSTTAGTNSRKAAIATSATSAIVTNIW